MAIKPDRLINETDISLVCNDVHEKGTVLIYGPAASGSPSGYKVAGLSLANFVDIDQTRVHRNFHKDEQVIGEKAPLLRKGYVVTNKVTGSPTVGDKAYLTVSGLLTPTVSAGGGEVATPRVGTFAGAKDENGYVKVYVELPN
jgi:hypothetical protein